MTIKPLIAVGFLALVGVQGASADPAYPPGAQPRSYVFVAPNGPTVLKLDGCCQVVVPANRPDLAVPPIPVAEVMNGGGFGLTGFDYYNDQVSEGRFGARRRPKEYVIAPAYVVPPRY